MMLKIKDYQLQSLHTIIDKEFLFHNKIYVISDVKYHHSYEVEKTFWGKEKSVVVYYVDSFKITFYDGIEGHYVKEFGSLSWLENFIYMFDIKSFRKEYLDHKRQFDLYMEFCNKNK